MAYSLLGRVVLSILERRLGECGRRQLCLIDPPSSENQPLPPFPLVHGVEKGRDNSALHLFKGKGGAVRAACVGPLHLSGEEHYPAEQHHVLRE